MSNAKVVMGQAANTLAKPLNVEDVFSTYLYTGNASTQTITNGIDLDGEGGLVWVKGRSGTSGSSGWGGDIGHTLFDSSAPQRPMNSALTNPRTNFGAAGVNFTSTGFTVGYNGFNDLNYSTFPYVSWTFRKAPKFFDVVTYTGDGTDERQIAHNLGGPVGCLMVKCTSEAADWQVLHKDTTRLVLNTTAAAYNVANTAARFGDDVTITRPTSTHFTVSTPGNADTNKSGATYVAYLFAHNDGDGEFGPDADADIIKCGSYTGNGSGTAGPTVDLGFEPQWILTKRTDSTGYWTLVDAMRGMVVGGDDKLLYPNTSDAEQQSTRFVPSATGFQVNSTNSYVNASGGNYIYIAIRRGTKVPESATEVFASDFARAAADGEKPEYRSGFPVDTRLTLYRSGGSSSYPAIGSRITGNEYLVTSSTAAGGAWTAQTFDYMNGFMNTAANTINTTLISHMWKRAPGFFDVVAYTGDGVAGRTVSHNLGVAPEMMWVKKRNNAGSWAVYHKGVNGGVNPENYHLFLESNSGAATDSDYYWYQTAPTATEFSLGISATVNQSSANDYVAYLFASLPGISKVGSYTGNGTGQNIDCGFSSGARFVLIKNASTGGTNWMVFDSTRGIVSGSEPHLRINTTTAEVTNDQIDPYSGGFALTDNDQDTNGSGSNYIFYAIA